MYIINHMLMKYSDKKQFHLLIKLIRIFLNTVFRYHMLLYNLVEMFPTSNYSFSKLNSLFNQIEFFLNTF